MNRLPLAAILVSALLGMNAAMASDTHTQHHAIETHQPNVMEHMHKHMSSAEPVTTDNLDYNFIANMIPHHQDAIDSAKFLLQQSCSPDLSAIAKAIVRTQTAEVESFEKLLAELKTEKTTWTADEVAKFNREALATMERMHHDMGSVHPSGNIERDFLLGMKAHHEGAVEASKQILQYSKNPKIIAIANAIIAAQDEEIRMFDNMLGQMTH